MNDDIYRSLFEIVSFFNKPKQDRALLNRAGVKLDTALFPLLMRISAKEPIGIVGLSEQIGRDHSTVSRQVNKLLMQDLIAVKTVSKDRRTRQLIVTPSGKALVRNIAKARRVMMSEALGGWTPEELAELKNSLDSLAKSLGDYSVKD